MKPYASFDDEYYRLLGYDFDVKFACGKVINTPGRTLDDVVLSAMLMMFEYCRRAGRTTSNIEMTHIYHVGTQFPDEGKIFDCWRVDISGILGPAFYFKPASTDRRGWLND